MSSRMQPGDADIQILINPQSSPHGNWVNMRRPRETGKVSKAKRLLCIVCLCSVMVILAGCSTTHKAAGDPLLGEIGPKGGPGAAPPASIPRSKNEVSSAPSATGTNLASLAALPDGRPLAISHPETAADPPAWTGPTALASTPKTPAGATLSPPVPVVQPVPRSTEEQVVPASSWDKAASAASGTARDSSQVPTVGGGIPVPQAPPAAAPAPAAATQQPSVTEDPVLAQLRARGVTWQKADNVAGGVRLTCIVPNRQHPEVTRTYEVVGPDYPAAVRAMLFQIDREQKKQPGT